MRKEMEELILGNRVLSISCQEKVSEKIKDYFSRIVRKHEKDILELMDEYEIPPQVIIYFRKGNHTLDGIYRVQSRIVSKHLAVIEIFTEKWAGVKKREIESPDVEKELIHTFAHELIHHRYENENETEKRAKLFLKNLKF
jgi:hypothetical protein